MEADAKMLVWLGRSDPVRSSIKTKTLQYGPSSNPNVVLWHETHESECSIGNYKFNIKASELS